MKSTLSLVKAFSTLLSRKKAPEVFDFLSVLFTEKELDFAEKRLQVAQMLERKNSYSVIQKELKVSAATVASVSELMKNSTFLKISSEMTKELYKFSWLKEKLKR